MFCLNSYPQTIAGDFYSVLVIHAIPSLNLKQITVKELLITRTKCSRNLKFLITKYIIDEKNMVNSSIVSNIAY